MTESHYKPIIHDDSTITYWSVYDQVWHRYSGYVPARELAAMPSEERRRVIEALGLLSQED